MVVKNGREAQNLLPHTVYLTMIFQVQMKQVWDDATFKLTTDGKDLC